MPTGGKLSVISATGGGVGCSATWDGFKTGDQVLPVSKLSSVKMSKKLLIMKPPSMLRTVVWPSEGRVGLSRSIAPPGNVPCGSRARISASNSVVSASAIVALALALTFTGTVAWLKLFPPSVEYWKSNSVGNEEKSCGQNRHGVGGD